jgi:hypothetical protein
VLRGTADIYVGMSQIAFERNDLDTAARHLRHSQELGEPAGLPQNRYRWRVAMARALQARGDPDGALDLLDEAAQVYTGDFSPNVRPVPAMTARLLAVQGRVGEALTWAREHGVSADDESVPQSQPDCRTHDEAAQQTAKRPRGRSAVVLRAGQPSAACISQIRISAGSVAVTRWPPVAVKRTASPVPSGPAPSRLTAPRGTNRCRYGASGS